jgi:hypothetical protein
MVGMFTHLARRLTFANVVAALALFVALGGTGYAAFAVTGKNVVNGSLTGADVRNGTLLAKDFKTGQLPAGEPGPPGPPGTVDTSNFYDKAASDARFLGAAAKADLTTRGITSSQAPGFGLGALTSTRTITVALAASRPVLLLAGADVWSYNGQCSGDLALSIDGTLEPSSYATGTAAAAPNVNTYANISTSAMPTLAAGSHTIILKTASYGACVGFETARLHAVVLDG